MVQDAEISDKVEDQPRGECTRLGSTLVSGPTIMRPLGSALESWPDTCVDAEPRTRNRTPSQLVLSMY